MNHGRQFQTCQLLDYAAEQLPMNQKFMLWEEKMDLMKTF